MRARDDQGDPAQTGEQLIEPGKHAPLVGGVLKHEESFNKGRCRGISGMPRRVNPTRIYAAFMSVQERELIMKMYYTERGDRPDLAARAKLTQASIGGYAFPKLFPVLPVTERAGDFSYAPVGMVTGTTNVAEARANGAELTANALATADFAWTTARLEARTVIYANEVKGFGGIEAADGFGGEGLHAARTTRSHDCAITRSSAPPVAVRRPSCQPSGRDVAAEGALAQRKSGQPYLVMTSYGLLKFVNIPEVRGGCSVNTPHRRDELHHRRQVQLASNLSTDRFRGHHRL